MPHSLTFDCTTYALLLMMHGIRKIDLPDQGCLISN